MEEVLAHVHPEPIVTDVLSSQHEHSSGVLAATCSSAIVRLPVEWLRLLTVLGLTPDSQSLPIGSGTSQMPPAPGLGFTAFQSAAYGSSGFQAPPSPGTAGSLTPHQPISQASSSDEEEGQDALGRGHRVEKKIVRFMPYDWP
ncbi:hypothetical protein M9H77_31707 [Catharanthus roseus]|uniref:Uncharacterized protein n=1 Tax=Catharanthus roseus TaxID=4058 RepID=A0ACC0A0T0_CATRO|nr:hypothetical protein M9H77_31707 [Catharanthus roseus]